jgi:uncharacterized protein YuzE
MSDLNQLFVRSSNPPTVEIDPSCHSVYIRFKTARVHKTVSNDKPGIAVVAVDLDSRGEIIGVELVGVREFSIAAIRHILPLKLKRIDFDRAKFMPAACCNREAVTA